MNENQSQQITYVQHEDEIHLSDYIDVLYDNRWLILLFTAVVFFVSLFATWKTTPTYRADALIQVEEKSSGIPGLSDMSELLSGEAEAVTEIEIIRSRSILGKTVQDLNLDIIAHPLYFPVIGKALARGNKDHNNPNVSLPAINTSSFARGGETIKIESFNLPDHLFGEVFLVTAQPGDTYILTDEDDNIILKGRVGELASSDTHRISLFISRLSAKAETGFILQRISTLKAIDNLKQKLSVDEKGKKTGILELSIIGENPNLNVAILNSIANTYLRQNVERLSAEAAKSLHFLQSQLPGVKEDLAASETLLNNYRLNRQSVDLTIETQAILGRVVELESAHSELALKKVELERKYTTSHPTLEALVKQQQRIKNQQKDLTGRINELPETQQEILRLSRDVQVNTIIYTGLLNKIQELKVVRAGTVGNVRILDYAASSIKPVKPKVSRNLLLALILGVFGGIGLAFIRKAMNRGVDQPDQVEEQLGLSVYAAVPFSDKQNEIEKDLVKSKSKSKSKSKILALVENNDAAIESLRSLRTNLHFALLEADNNMVMISGPAPAVGKTFISVNFGMVLAQASSRVLIIDADMRKGYMNRYFGHERSPGLSELISGDVNIDQAVHKTSQENLDALFTGALPPNPSELLMHENFQQILNKFSQDYDLVLIDTPPTLAVTDASIIGRLAGTCFLVLRSGLHPMQEIEASIKRLKHNGITAKGAIFNAIPRTKRYHAGYGKYGYYNYEYNKDK